MVGHKTKKMNSLLANRVVSDNIHRRCTKRLCHLLQLLFATSNQSVDGPVLYVQPGEERDSIVVTEASVCYCECLKLPPPAALAVPLLLTTARAGLQEKCGKN